MVKTDTRNYYKYIQYHGCGHNTDMTHRFQQVFASAVSTLIYPGKLQKKTFANLL